MVWFKYVFTIFSLKENINLAAVAIVNESQQVQ